MDKFEREAMQNVPAGYFRVLDGEIRADDLIWSQYEQPTRFRRADDPEWQQKCESVEDCYCVVRLPVHRPAAGQTVRTYKISNDLPHKDSEQGQLFFSVDQCKGDLN